VGAEGVLVAGAINTDLVARVHHAPEAGETVTGTTFDVFGGGKGANQALAAVRSGARTTMLGALGADEFGRARLLDLRADGVDVDDVMVVGGVSSGVALIVVDDAGQNRIAYVPGATATVAVETALGALARVRPSVVLSTLELPSASLRSLFAEARSAGATVILNATPEPAAGRDLVPFADILIVNETEALELLGEVRDGGEWPAITSALRELGPTTAIVTVGPAGAVGDIGGTPVAVAAPTVQVVDTTGAGDAFCGAFAARLAAGAGVAEAVRAGVAAGSLATTVAGAQRSMPTRSEVDQMMAKMAE